MKKLKFRAWNKITKSMIIESPISMASIIRDHIRTAYSINGDIIGSEYVVMQWTGLTDRNFVDIYEDDIVKIVNKFYKVAYVDDSYMLKDLEQSRHYLGLYCYRNEAHVIGNIYENPELLNYDPRGKECQ